MEPLPEPIPPGATRFGALLRHHRRAAGLSQEALAARAGLSPRALRYLEHGDRRPYPETLRQLAAALDLPSAERAALAAALDDAPPDPPAHLADERASGPALATVPLPVPPSPLLGRAADIAALAALLDGGARLVTLTGPGGVGKTRLALEVATRAGDTAVAFAALAPLRDPQLVLPEIARAIGVRAGAQGPLVAQLVAALRGHSLLLVLDNVEQVVAAAPAVAELLAACPRLRVLATSRAPLRLRAERVYQVEPLTLADPAPMDDATTIAAAPAVALFVERARATWPAFALTAANARAVADVCARLDGLPLAIELAAARVRLLPPEALLARLNRRLPLLTGGVRDLPDRQRTLRATLDWSERLLDPPARAVFRRLGIFAGGCSLDAVAAVCNAPRDLGPAVLEVVEALVDQSLLRRDDGAAGAPRFGMLETIREYAAAQLAEAGEREVVAQQHAAYFLALAEEASPALVGADQDHWFARLAAEHDDIRAAISWALERGEAATALRLVGAVWRFWETRGHVREGRRWLDAALALPAPASPARGVALNGAGILAFQQGDAEASRARHEEDLALRRALGDGCGIAQALNNLGVLARERGDLASAWTLHMESLTIRRALGDQRGIGQALNNLGMVAHRRGDEAAARSLCEQSLALRRAVGDQRGLAVALFYLGAAARGEADLEHALACYREGLTIGQSLGNWTLVAEGLEGVASVLAAAGDPADAAGFFGAAAALRDATGVPLTPAACAECALWEDRAHERLTPDAWAAAWALGRALAPDDALALARRASLPTAGGYAPPTTRFGVRAGTL